MTTRRPHDDTTLEGAPEGSVMRRQGPMTLCPMRRLAGLDSQTPCHARTLLVSRRLSPQIFRETRKAMMIGTCVLYAERYTRLMRSSARRTNAPYPVLSTEALLRDSAPDAFLMGVICLPGSWLAVQRRL